MKVQDILAVITVCAGALNGTWHHNYSRILISIIQESTMMQCFHLDSKLVNDTLFPSTSHKESTILSLLLQIVHTVKKIKIYYEVLAHV